MSTPATTSMIVAMIVAVVVVSILVVATGGRLSSISTCIVVIGVGIVVLSITTCKCSRCLCPVRWKINPLPDDDKTGIVQTVDRHQELQ